jgi:hypothetical protein
MESPATEREGAGDSIKRIKAADSKQLSLTQTLTFLSWIKLFVFIYIYFFNEKVLMLIENNF